MKLEAYHANIKDPHFNVDWFSKFDIVFNALDNLDARRHVNKMCLAANVPLIESGTTGFNGQVQPILKVGWITLGLDTMTGMLTIAGQERVLRLQHERNPKELSRLYHPKHTEPAHTLHRVG